LIFFGYAIYVILSQKRFSEMQKEFINNMTHEFKTPISSIKISSDVISKSSAIQEDERLSKYVDIIRDQNTRLNTQVEQVLSLAKLERDQFKLKKEKIEIPEIFEEVEQSHRMRIESLEGSLQIHIDKDLPSVSADHSHFTNVLNNLIDNAVKYSEERPKIGLRAEKKPNGISISVSDKGIGVSKDQMEKITEKFYRVPSGNIHDVKGFGLGLYYVKNICKAHGWEFTMVSELGEGTKCTIFIPSAKYYE
jgi:two-component system phosphate regulon sensor histidine kinase PhoR